jgi:hypothetical protein
LSDLLQCNAGESGQEGLQAIVVRTIGASASWPAGFVSRFPARRFAHVQHRERRGSSVVSARSVAHIQRQLGRQAGVDPCIRSAQIGV